MCREQLGKLPGRMSELTREGAAVFAISIDPPSEATRLAKDLGLPFAILSDPTMEVIRAYEMKGAGMDMADMGYAVIDREGRLRARRVDREFGDNIGSIARAVRDSQRDR